MTRVTKTTRLRDAIHGCSSWESFHEALRDLSEKQKGDIFEELVKAYLLLEPEYGSKLTHVWLYRDVPQTVREKLKLPPSDQGNPGSRLPGTEVLGYSTRTSRVMTGRFLVLYSAVKH